MSSTAELFKHYYGAMALVEVITPQGETKVGSAFHLGDGVFATARHVVEGMVQVRLVVEGHHEPEHAADIGRMILSEEADVALILCDGPHPEVAVGLGGHYDDWIVDKDFYLWPVLIMGYPPIPMSDGPRLVAVSGEVNAVVDRYDVRHPHFVVSPLPRGGFSGGPAIVGMDFCLGVINHELMMDETKSGFTAVISVEPLWSLMFENDVVPHHQRWILNL
jgi:hypothetical protein